LSSQTDFPEEALEDEYETPKSRRQIESRRASRAEAQAAAHSLRHRVHMVLEAGRSSGSLGLAFEIFLIALIVSNAVVVSLDSVQTLAAAYGRYFLIFEYVSVAVFTVEYGLRLWSAPEDPRYADRPVVDRLRYMLQPYMVIDLVAVAPAYIALFMPVADLRILRLFRLFRLLKIARYSPAVTTLIHVLSHERRALFGTLLLLLCIMCLSAEGMYIIEGTAQPKSFGDLPTCMYWAIITLTTVGYGDITPVTALGRAWAGITAILGLGIFALPVGIIASAFMTEIHRRDFVVTSGMLAKIPLFAGLDIEVLSEVMVALRSQMVAPHIPIVVAGESASTMYFVVSGLAKSVRVTTEDGVRRKATLGPGEVIAADAVLAGRTYDASVFAHTPMRLLALSSQDLVMLLRKYPRLRKRIDRTAARAERRFQQRRPRSGPSQAAPEGEDE
jgi:voltage-gated potassium channel